MRASCKTPLAFFMALLLATSLVPATAAPTIAHAETSTLASTASVASWPNNIDQLLEAGDFVEGEAIAIVREQTAAPYSLRSRTLDLLSGAESLATVSTEAYEQTAAGSAGEQKDEAPAAAPFSLRGPAAQATQDDFESLSIILVKADGLSTQEILEALAHDSRVLTAQPNYLRTIADYEPAPAAAEANLQALRSESDVTAVAIASEDFAEADLDEDPGDLTAYQWGFNNPIGSDGENTSFVTPNISETPDDFDVNPPAWNDPATKNADFVVAIFDTGVDYTHPDLDGVMVDNMTDYNPAGGAYGFNATTDPDDPAAKDPMDEHNHGTHVAGIVAAEWNGTGTSGIANGVKLVAVRTADSNGFLADSSILRGYQYLSDAVDGGLNLVAINNSWSGSTPTEAICAAINELGSKGVVSLFAASNSSENNDDVPILSSTMYDSPYLTVIGASTMAGKPASYSNYGALTVDVFAPGEDILSTIPQSAPRHLALASTNDLISHPFSNDDLSDIRILNAKTLTAVEAYQTTDSSLPEGIDRACTLDASGGSLAIRASDVYYQENGEPGPECMIRIDLIFNGASEEEALAQAQKASFASVGLLTSQDHLDALTYLQTKRGSKGGWVLDTFSGLANNAWSFMSVDLKDAASYADGALCLIEQQEDGTYTATLSIGLRIVDFSGETISPDTWFYLDTLSVGNSAVAYGILGGTSMATPAATGAAAILAARHQADAGKRSAEDAAELTALLKGSVRPFEAFTNLCTSNGQIDLSLERSQFTPAISIVEFVEDDQLLDVSGWWFGSEPGSATVDGKNAEIVSWNENADGTSTATLRLPDGLDSGVYAVSITATNGKTGTGPLFLELPADQPDNAIPLFEKEIDLSACEGLECNSPINTLVGYGGDLYLFIQNPVTIFDSAYRYDPETDTITPFELPEGFALTSLSAATYDGKLLAFGSPYPGTSIPTPSEAVMALYAYDLETDTWEELPLPAGVPYLSVLVNFNGKLLAIGGVDPIPLEQGYPTTLAKDNILELDLDAGTATPVGTLEIGRMGIISATPFDSTLYVTNGQDNSGLLSGVLEAHTWEGETLTSVSVEGLLPEHAAGDKYSPIFSLTNAADGALAVGYNAVDENGALLADDTFYLGSTDGETPFEAFGKRPLRETIIVPTALAYDGWLYAMGTGYYEDEYVSLRATRVETLPSAGDVVVEPDDPSDDPADDPNDDPADDPSDDPADNPSGDADDDDEGATLVDTGDHTPITLLLALAFASLCGLRFASRKL